jgi:hypothetical protein
VLWINDEADKSQLTIDAVLAKIDGLSIQLLTVTGAWSLNQVLDHCAQSVEYSMTGFPKHKSAVFKNTFGRVAFTAFSAKGQMVHALDEVIPGAPVIQTLEATPDENQHAFARLKKSLREFQEYQGNLAPHSAYGTLSKADYELAHVMHFYNHLDEIEQS